MTYAAAPAWLILADDLTGACDCAVPFAAVGDGASVLWNGAVPSTGTVAIDTDSRRLSATAAAEVLRVVLGRAAPSGRRLFKKIDSTLRGQPAAEIAAVIGQRRAAGKAGLTLLSPAFPATGRTMQGGQVFLHGVPLTDTALWARDHSYPTADLAAILRAEGLRVLPLGVETVRGDAEKLRGRLRAAAEDRTEVVLCDAETADDLERMAAAGLPLQDEIVWAGSGGLALALAQAMPARASSPPPAVPRLRGGNLFVVGSIAEASRAAAAVLAADAGVRPVAIPAHLLRAAAASGMTDEIAATLAAGSDVLVTIVADEAPDLAEGAVIAAGLARLLAPAAPALGALFATGGETARALLQSFGVTAIRLLGEIEPGMPWGMTQGAIHCPIVTKAGGFGNAETLRRCLNYLRDLRRQETAR